MAVPNTTSARVVDPVLTTQARGYRNPDIERVRELLFPTAVMPARGAKVIRFGKEGFRAQNTSRAPGGAVRRVRVGYESETVNLAGYALSGAVAAEVLQESAATAPSVNLAARAVEQPMEVIARGKELAAATVATTAANYASSHVSALSGTDKWSDAGSDPAAQVDAAASVIRASTGREPNTVVVSPSIFRRLRRHPKALAQLFPGTKATPGMITRAQVAEYLGVARLGVAGDVYLPAGALDSDDFSDVWGNFAVLAYVPTAGETSIEVPSYGYTYQLDGYPLVEAPWWDNDHREWVYPVLEEYACLITSPEAGFLFSGVL